MSINEHFFFNSQTGIIMTLLGATQEETASDKKEKTKMDSSIKIEDANSNGEAPEKVKKHKKSHKKHRSVLQIKLGKLALQIGYGGMPFSKINI